VEEELVLDHKHLKLDLQEIHPQQVHLKVILVELEQIPLLIMDRVEVVVQDQQVVILQALADQQDQEEMEYKQI
jgi:hypothetical protein